MKMPMENKGKEIEFEAVRSMDAYLENNRIRIGTQLKDGTILYIWMAEQDFRTSLSLLHLAAQKMNIPWPGSN
jgi:hypothetical protein